MELKRVIALDSRAANEKAIQLYGENVLVISSERVDNQTELIVAVDLEPAFVEDEAETAGQAAPGVETARIHAPGAGMMSFSDWLQQGVEPQRTTEHAPERAETRHTRTAAKAAPTSGAMAAVDAVLPSPQVAQSSDSEHERLRSREVIALVREEFETLRKELLSARAFAVAEGTPAAGRAGAAAHDLMQAMADIGVPLALRTQLMAGLQSCDDASQALDAAQAALAKALARCGDAAPSATPRRTRGVKGRTEGGRSANGPQIEVLVGPSGCGKTSMAVRLAAEAAAQHGAGSQAIVSFRDGRPGAWSQLQTLAALAGVDCWRAQNDETLQVILSELAGHHTVWVDTGGLDFMNTAQALQQLCPHALMHAVLPQDASFTSAQRMLARPPLAWASLMISKADESGHAWPLISTLCAHPLAVSRVSHAAQVTTAALPFDAPQLAAMAFAPLRESMSHAPAQTEANAAGGSVLALPNSTLASLAQRAATIEVLGPSPVTAPAPRAASRKRTASATGKAKK